MLKRSTEMEEKKKNEAEYQKHLEEIEKEVRSYERFNSFPDDLYDHPYHYDGVKIAMYGKFSLVAASDVGAPLELKKELENEYDNKAVAVLFEGKKVGYIYKGKLQDMINDYLLLHDVVASVDWVTGSDLTIVLDFYKIRINDDISDDLDDDFDDI